MTGNRLLLVGCYTHDSPTGIHVYDASDAAGTLVATGRVDGLEHPSFLAAHPNGGIVYAVSETVPDGAVVALRLDPADGSLTRFDHASSHGAAPCHVSVDPAGRHVYVANYGSGTVAAYAIALDGGFGELIAVHRHAGSGPHARQAGPHAHCIVPNPDGNGVYAVDLGTDRISHYRHDSPDAFRLAEEVALDPGTGPRHLAFHPRAPVAYAVGELDSTIISLAVDRDDGRLRPRFVASTLPDGYTGESIGAEVRVHPTGRHVYVSNRGHDSIAVFGFAGPDQPLEPVGHVPSGGRTPRNFAVHPAGRTLVVANQDSGTLVAFAVDEHTGLLRRNGVVAEVSEPVCVTFVEVDR